MVSIVVPVYNLEKYIGQTIESLLNQTISEYEIILVDDGSTDSSPTILDDYAKRSDKVVVLHQQNAGVTSARMNGVRCASGEWIGFVDGDDIVLPDMYERLLVNAKNYNAQISHCGYQMVFGNGNKRFFYNTGRIVRQDNLTGLQDLLEGSFIEPGLWNKLFHKTLFHSLLHTRLMDESVKNNEDLLMNYYLFKESSRSVYEDFCPYMYIIREQSASHGVLNQNKIFDPIKVKKIIWKDSFSNQFLMPIASRAYISTCINCYNTVCVRPAWKAQAAEIRIELCKNKKQFKLLSRNKKISAWIIVLCPKVYRYLISVYSRFLRKKKYS